MKHPVVTKYKEDDYFVLDFTYPEKEAVDSCKAVLYLSAKSSDQTRTIL